jgi:hypothetical protein
MPFIVIFADSLIGDNHKFAIPLSEKNKPYTAAGLSGLPA